MSSEVLVYNSDSYSDSEYDSESETGCNRLYTDFDLIEETLKANIKHNLYPKEDEKIENLIYNKGPEKKITEEIQINNPQQIGGTSASSDKIIVSSVFGIVVLISSVLLGSVG